MSENQRRPVGCMAPGARMGGEKASFKGTIKKLVKYMGSYWPAFVAVYFLRSAVPCSESSDPRSPVRLRREAV